MGPSLAGVAATWPSCADQIEWIALGSDGWRSLYGDTYGSAEKPVEGGMPAHAARLTEGEMALVAAFERIEYGGEDADDALADCGVAGPTE